MDFEFHFTRELEQFRKEVRSFIEENALSKPLVPVDNMKMTVELHQKGRELQRKLGAKGWYAPAYPKEYGGGGLDVERCVILAQEFAAVREERRWPGLRRFPQYIPGGSWPTGLRSKNGGSCPHCYGVKWKDGSASLNPRLEPMRLR